VSDASRVVVEDLLVEYGKVEALEDISLSVKEGETVAVIGPNGAGKTTLADTIAGLKEYESGSLRYRGTEIADTTTRRLTEEGLIYCTEHRNLFGYMDVETNLILGAYRNREAVEERLELVYDLFPRLEERADQRARTLSGGEQQMLAVGRSLMGGPGFLILDEPTIGLAPVIVNDISDGLDRIGDEEQLTVLLLEQNVTFAMRHADRIYLLENGEIARKGTPDELREDDYVADAYIGQ